MQFIIPFFYIISSIGRVIRKGGGLDEAEAFLGNWRENDFDVLDVRQGEIQIGNIIWNGFIDEGGARLDMADADNLPPEGINIYNYPNPFNLNTTIYFELLSGTVPDYMSVNVYTILGEKVKNLDEMVLDNGWGSVI